MKHLRNEYMIKYNIGDYVSLVGSLSDGNGHRIPGKENFLQIVRLTEYDYIGKLLFYTADYLEYTFHDKDVYRKGFDSPIGKMFVDLDSIEYWSSNREDLEAILTAKKYNL